MSAVDENRLKGNYGAAFVTARLSSECLVRPVAADTDVGVDLYCETIEAGSPFLHFWVQVKAGAQCRLVQNGAAASCSFSVEHLDYWFRQPVPVFGALVPVDWPVRQEPCVYIVDLTSQLLGGVPSDRDSVTLTSDYRWRPGVGDDVRQFLEQIVPTTAARVQCRNGVIASIPTIRPTYVITSPTVPVTRFQTAILSQIRRTAALSIMSLRALDELGNEHVEFRRTLAAIVEQFGDDPHWENFMARALAYHADGHFDRAVEFYNRAVQCIRNDSNVAALPSWREIICDIELLRDRGLRRERHDGTT